MQIGSNRYSRSKTPLRLRLGGGFVLPPVTNEFTYLQALDGWGMERDERDPTRMFVKAWGPNLTQGSVWAGWVTGSSVAVRLGANGSFNADTFEFSLDGGAWFKVTPEGSSPNWFPILVNGPDQKRFLMIRVGAAYGVNNAHVPKQGNSFRITGAAPALEPVQNQVQPADLNPLVLSANAFKDQPHAGYLPEVIVNRDGDFRVNHPGVAVRGNFSELTVVASSRWVSVAAEGDTSPMLYDLGTTLPAARTITGLSGVQTYFVATSGNLLSVGGKVTGGLASIPTPRRLDQYGDSITEGVSASSALHVDVNLIAASLGFMAGNFGISGQTTAQLLARLPAILATKDVTSNDVAILAIGRNDVLTNWTQAVQTAYAQVVGLLLAKGYGKVICRGILPEGTAQAPSRANTENGSIRRIVAEFADPRVVYLDTDSWVGIAFSDGVHPTDAGYIQIANYARPAIQPLVPLAAPAMPTGAQLLFYSSDVPGAVGVVRNRAETAPLPTNLLGNHRPLENPFLSTLTNVLTRTAGVAGVDGTMKAVRFTYTSGSTPLGRLRQVRLPAGTYTAQVDAISHSGTAQIKIRIDGGTLISPDRAVGTSWTTISYTFTLAAETTVSLEIGGTNGTPFDVSVDNMAISLGSSTITLGAATKHLVISPPALRPALLGTTIEGTPYLRSIMRAQLTPEPVTPTAYSVVAAVRMDDSAAETASTLYTFFSQVGGNLNDAAGGLMFGSYSATFRATGTSGGNVAPYAAGPQKAGWVVLSFTGDAAGLALFVNKVKVAQGSTAYVPGTFSAVEVMGAADTLSRSFYGRMAFLGAWDRKLSDAELSAAVDLAIAQIPSNSIHSMTTPFTDISTVWVAEGDSITAGSGDGDNIGGYVSRATRKFPTRLQGINLGVINAGITASPAAAANDLNGANRKAATRAKVVELLNQGKRVIFSVLIGANNIGAIEANPTTYYNLVKAYMDEFRQLGARTVAQTILDQQTLTAAQRTAVGTFNQLLRDGRAAGGFDGLVDHAATALGTWNATYMNDGAHPNAAGHELMATTFRNSLSVLVTGNPVQTAPLYADDFNRYAENTMLISGLGYPSVDGNWQSISDFGDVGNHRNAARVMGGRIDIGSNANGNPSPGVDYQQSNPRELGNAIYAYETGSPNHSFEMTVRQSASQSGYTGNGVVVAATHEKSAVVYQTLGSSAGGSIKNGDAATTTLPNQSLGFNFARLPYQRQPTPGERIRVETYGGMARALRNGVPWGSGNDYAAHGGAHPLTGTKVGFRSFNHNFQKVDDFRIDVIPGMFRWDEMASNGAIYPIPAIHPRTRKLGGFRHGAADITFTGTYLGFDSGLVAGVECAVFDAITNQQMTAWADPLTTTIDTTAKTYAVTVRVPCGLDRTLAGADRKLGAPYPITVPAGTMPYRIAIRAKENHTTEVHTRDTFIVTANLVVCGQSNGAGLVGNSGGPAHFGGSIICPPWELVKRKGTYNSGVMGLVEGFPNSPNDGTSAWLTKILSDATGIPWSAQSVAIAASGAGASDPENGQGSGDFVKFHLQQYPFEAIYMNQGENEVNTAAATDFTAWKAQWTTNLNNIRAYNKQPSDGVPIHVFVGMTGRYDGAPTTNPNMDRLRVAQVELAREYPNAHLAFHPAAAGSDGLHYTLPGVIVHNKRVGLTVRKWLAGASYDGLGPKAIRAVKGTNTVTLHLDMNGAASLTSTNNSGTGLTGFQVATTAAFTAPLAHTAAIVGNTVVITLTGGDPGAQVYVRSFVGNIPDQTNLVQGVYPNDTVYLPRNEMCPIIPAILSVPA